MRYFFFQKVEIGIFVCVWLLQTEVFQVCQSRLLGPACTIVLIFYMMTKRCALLNPWLISYFANLANREWGKGKINKKWNESTPSYLAKSYLECRLGLAPQLGKHYSYGHMFFPLLQRFFLLSEVRKCFKTFSRNYEIFWKFMFSSWWYNPSWLWMITQILFNSITSERQITLRLWVTTFLPNWQSP